MSVSRNHIIWDHRSRVHRICVDFGFRLIERLLANHNRKLNAKCCLFYPRKFVKLNKMMNNFINQFQPMPKFFG